MRDHAVKLFKNFSPLYVLVALLSRVAVSKFREGFVLYAEAAGWARGAVTGNLSAAGLVRYFIGAIVAHLRRGTACVMFAECRAVQWLLDQGLIDENLSQQFGLDHPDPELP